MRYFISAVSHWWATISGQRKNRRCLRIEEEHRIGFGEARRIGHREGRRPLAVVWFQRAPRIRTSSAVRSPEPWNQQTSRSPLGSLDHRGRVVVPRLGREDQLARELGLCGRDNRQPGDGQQDGEDSGAWAVIIEVRRLTRGFGTRGLGGSAARMRLGFRMSSEPRSPESRAPDQFDRTTCAALALPRRGCLAAVRRT